MKFSITLFLFIITILSYGQNKSANNWYFGNHAVITFNTQPPTAIPGSAMNTLQHSSSISDSNGNLLFYTDGITVWDKTNAIMPNGTNLKGDCDLPFGERVIIIPYPQNVNLYYIFCISFSGLYYSVIDITLNNGNGDVLNTEKNIFIESDVKNFLTAVGNEISNTYWLLIQRGGANQGVRAYKIDTNGFNSSAIINNIPSATLLKFTPSGLHVAVANGELGIIIYNFDNQTGVLDNPLILIPSGTLEIQSLAFSQNEQYLYINNRYRKITQFDLLAGSSTEIVNSAYTVYENTEGKIHTLQLGSNGKIYISNTNQSFLSAINSPNEQGVACNFVHDAVYLGGDTTNYGLPTFVQSFFLPQTVEIITANNCLTDPTNFTISNTENIQSTLWNFGDSQTSTELNPAHTYLNPGTYTVTLTITYNDNSTKTINKQITIYNQPVQNIILHH